MNRKTVVNLLLVTIGLFALYWLSYTDTRKQKVSSGRQLLLSHVNWNEVASIELHKEGESITLGSGDSGGWFVPLRGNYPARVSSIRSFLLKLMDLSSSQTIETTDTGIEKMGLASYDGEESRGGIVLRARDGKEIETLYLGSLRTRKSATDEETLSLSGQFVRLGSSGEVYLVPLPLTVATDAGGWIEASVLKVEQDQVYQVKAVSRKDNEEVLRYTINRKGSLISDTEPEYVFSEKAPQDREVSQTVVRQLTMALEDLKAEDVYPHEDEAVKDFQPEKSVYYSLVNGLVYGVHIQDIDGAYFLKLEVSRDEELIESLKAKFEEEKTLASAKEAEKDSEKDSEEKETEEKEDADKESDSDGDQSGKTDPEDSAEKVAEKEEQVLQVATGEDVKREQNRLGSWVYVVPDFVGKKFMKEVDMFFKEISTEDNDPQP